MLYCASGVKPNVWMCGECNDRLYKGFMIIDCQGNKTIHKVREQLQVYYYKPRIEGLTTRRAFRTWERVDLRESFRTSGL